MLAAHYLGFFILLFSLTASAQTQAFGRIVVFGDDSTDSGNFAQWSDENDDGLMNKSDSYFSALFAEGRATNFDSKKGNLLAIELLAKQLGHTLRASFHLTPNDTRQGGTNFSVIGAKSVSTGSGHDLPEQVSSFLKLNSEQYANTLFVLSIGSNDVREVRNGWSDNGTATELSLHEVEARLNRAAKSINTQLTRLIKGGARHFLVMNVADVGAMPETKLIAEYLNLKSGLQSDERTVNAIASAGVRTRIFNTKLSQILSKLTNSPEGKLANIRLFDVFDHLSQIKNDALLYGLINIEDACMDSGSMNFTKKCSANTANRYLYFDELHFSQATHQLLAGGLYDSFIRWNEPR